MVDCQLIVVYGAIMLSSNENPLLCVKCAITLLALKKIDIYCIQYTIHIARLGPRTLRASVRSSSGLKRMAHMTHMTHTLDCVSCVPLCPGDTHGTHWPCWCWPCWPCWCWPCAGTHRPHAGGRPGGRPGGRGRGGRADGLRSRLRSVSRQFFCKKFFYDINQTWSPSRYQFES